MTLGLAKLICLSLSLGSCGGPSQTEEAVSPSPFPPSLHRVAAQGDPLFSQDPLASKFALGSPINALPQDLKALSKFFLALSALESGDRTAPVTILHLGDSHTANDKMTGRLRTQFQNHFGNAGRGMLPPGRPFNYYHPSGVSVDQAGKWQLSNSFDQNAGGIYGVTGYRLRSRKRGDRLTLTANESQRFDWAEVILLEQKQGGTLRVRADGRDLYDLPSGEKAKGQPSPVRYQFALPPHTQSLTLTTRGDGVVDMLGWTIQKSAPGIIYDSQGIIGAQINIMEKWDKKAMRSDLHARKPALIVLAYGTNDGFGDKLTRDRYAKMVRTHLSFLQKTAPQASLLIMGPPDANRYPRRCGKARSTSPCSPLSRSEASNYKALFQDYPRGKRCRWHPPPKLSVVRETLKDVAQEMGFFFWDWSKVMGGHCGIHEWTRTNPKKAFADHVHLKKEGYEQSADQLFEELMLLYERFKAMTHTTEGNALQKPG